MSYLQSDDADNLDVPPVVACARCGSRDCNGCTQPPPARPATLTLAWERSDKNTWTRLWQTALGTSVDAERTFAELDDGPVLPVLAFAILAETLAISSFGALFALGAVSLAPSLSIRILTDPAALKLAAYGLAGTVTLMVGIHALWGICIELAPISLGRRGQLKRGVRFGLYACGWDLITSPLGIVQSVLSTGWAEAWTPVLAAARVPRIAVRAYTEHARGMTLLERRRAARLSGSIVGGLILGLLVLFAVWFVHALRIAF